MPTDRIEAGQMIRLCHQTFTLDARQPNGLWLLCLDYPPDGLTFPVYLDDATILRCERLCAHAVVFGVADQHCVPCERKRECSACALEAGALTETLAAR